MQIIDTHTHIYAKEFDTDRANIVQSAKNVGVEATFLPNEDSSSIEALLKTCDEFPDFAFPMMGLHPTSVKEDYIAELQVIEKTLAQRKFYAVGEIGIDLYWDKTFVNQQVIAFEEQLRWSMDLQLPVVIHTRNSFYEALESIYRVGYEQFKGIFHCFGGGLNEWNEIAKLPNFYAGIGGVITFKNSGLSDILPQIPLNRIVLETDAPYLAPVPHRGKRNEPAYIREVIRKVAECYQITEEEVATVTTRNAKNLFKLN
ncbi:MAG: TatD family hydrolase [Tannerella sp.]|jgi:TatD DNase family protein|nr:TatD family hydrolase [Tannerella sp.]